MHEWHEFGHHRRAGVRWNLRGRGVMSSEAVGEAHPDVAIIGGGVLGCALAYYLARDGVKVTLLKRGAIGAVIKQGVGFLLDVARQALPALMQATLKHFWHGFRPMRMDGGRPLAGALPGLSNVSIVTGQNSVGVMLSAGVGRLTANFLQGQPADALLTPFDAGSNGIIGV